MCCMGNETLKVMSFNMKHDTFSHGKNSWSKRAILVERVIRQNSPDIIGTQELTAACLADIHLLLPEYSYVGEGRGGGTNGEFSAIFFRTDRFSLLSEETFWLSRTPFEPSRAWFALFPRICTTCRLQSKDSGAVFQIYNTHLDHISYLARVNGLKLIVTRIMERQKTDGQIPVVLMGDFNATPNSKTLRSWQKALLGTEQWAPTNSSYNMLTQSTTGDFGRSYHGFKGTVSGNPIDYIFTSKDIALRAVEIRHDNFSSRFPSDHYPVIAELELTSPQTR
ncbi:MAG: endonuclease/exonuclease/phosphatase family protein [Angelakisella sp.]